MLNMILADDEVVIVRGIKKLVDWESLGILIVGEYENGSSAMEGILARRPDIALLDISMPGMNGIEILKSIRRLELPTKVIFISGFQDFEYAKNAITYGAVDYLIKPVIREELLHAVEKAVSSLSGEKLLAEPEEEKSVQQKELRHAVDLEQTTYLPVLTEILFEGSESGQEKKLIRFSVTSFLEEYLAEKGLGILFVKNEHIVMVLKGMDAERCKAVLTEVWRAVSAACGKKVGLVAGRIVDSMGQIPEEYERCLELCRYFFFADQMQIPVLTVGEEVFWRKAGEEDINAARDVLMDAIVVQDREAFLKAFESFSRILCLASGGRKEDADYYFCTTVRMVEQKLRSMNLEGRSPDVGELLERGRQCADFSRMKELFREYLEGYLELLKKKMESNEKKDILRAKEYIESHYQENLTLEILADVVHMNPYYFSSYFKKNAGENFKDYVNRVRIQRAVSLLVSTDMKTYEIAAQAGFRDVRAFTEAFSRAYGETPSSYRKRVLEKGE